MVGQQPFGGARLSGTDDKAGSALNLLRWVSPRTIKETFAKYSHLKDVLPAMGYDDAQVNDLKETIDKVPCDMVLVGTPFDLNRLVKIEKPMLRVTYELDDPGTAALEKIIGERLSVGAAR